MVIVHHWLNMLNIVHRCLDQLQIPLRRWWVKPHIRNIMRDNYGAYEMLFLYYANNDSEEFFNMVRMDVESFWKLYNMLHLRLRKTSVRKPLSGELRLALTLR